MLAFVTKNLKNIAFIALLLSLFTLFTLVNVALTEEIQLQYCDQNKQQFATALLTSPKQYVIPCQ